MEVIALALTAGVVAVTTDVATCDLAVVCWLGVVGMRMGPTLVMRLLFAAAVVAAVAVIVTRGVAARRAEPHAEHAAAQDALRCQEAFEAWADAAGVDVARPKTNPS
jgi:hypothetical protein